MPLTLVTIPCLSDNYAYLVHDPVSGQTAVVDVPEVEPIKAVLSTRGWSLTDIWITHHHHDHIGGVDRLREDTGARVTGAKADAHRLPNLDGSLEPGDRFAFGDSKVEVIDVSGHTVGHIAYYIPSEPFAFTGDSLMGLGCGRLFEGSPEMMWDSLSRLKALPKQTLICSGHEYSRANARFALTIEPDNSELVARSQEIDKLRDKDKPTIPVELAVELATNPFLRADLPSLKVELGLEELEDAAVFAEIRKRKDSF